MDQQLSFRAASTLAPLTRPEWAEADERRLVELTATGTWKQSEKEFFRKDGSRVPVLLGSAIFDELQHHGIGFVVDLTERKRVEAELAHENRVAIMGQLAASIAHEVNQPIAALLTNAATAARWLDRQQPNLEKGRPLIDRITRDGKRAADIVSRIRDFSKKEPARKTILEVNDAILEIIGLTHVESSKQDVSLKMQLSEGLPRIFADRVQLQQVILNLILNAIEAASEIEDGPREVLISSATDADVALIDDQDGAAVLAGRRHHLLEGFRDQGAHLADHAAAAHPVAQFEQDRVFAACLGHQTTGHALGHRCLAGPDVAVKNDERVLLGDEVAQRQAPAVMLTVPGGQLANVEQQAELFVERA
jgi:signal transduction histidine kinase